MKPKSNAFVNHPHIGAHIEIAPDMNIHCIDQGQGPALMLLHGLGQSLYTYRDNIDVLSAHYRVIVPDLPGFGYSDVPQSDFSVEDMVEMLRLFADALELDRFAVAGHGEGAVYALALAQALGDRVPCAVIESPGDGDRLAPPLFRRLRQRYFGELALMRMNPDTFLKDLQYAYFDETRVTQEVVEQYFAPFNSGTARESLLAAVRSFNPDPVLESLPRTRISVLLIWGENDAWNPPDQLALYENALLNCEVHLLRNCGRIPHEEKSVEYNQLVAAFLDRQPDIR